MEERMQEWVGREDMVGIYNQRAERESIALLRLGLEAAEVEHDAMARYERLQEARIQAVRETGMRALRVEVQRKQDAEKRAAFLEEQLREEYLKPRRSWVYSAVACFAFWGFVFWMVTK